MFFRASSLDVHMEVLRGPPPEATPILVFILLFFVSIFIVNFLFRFPLHPKSKLLLMNVEFLTRHIYLSGTEQLSV